MPVQTKNPLTITVLMRVSGLTLSELRAFLQRYWLPWERFRMLPVEKACGWCWQWDRRFDLANHLVNVPEAMDEARVALRVKRHLRPKEEDDFGIVTPATGLITGSPVEVRISSASM